MKHILAACSIVAILMSMSTSSLARTLDAYTVCNELNRFPRVCRSVSFCMMEEAQTPCQWNGDPDSPWAMAGKASCPLFEERTTCEVNFRIGCEWVGQSAAQPRCVPSTYY